MFFAPHDNTVLASISKMVQDRGLVTNVHIVSHIMKFHLPWFSLALSELERVPSKKSKKKGGGSSLLGLRSSVFAL